MCFCYLYIFVEDRNIFPHRKTVELTNHIQNEQTQIYVVSGARIPPPKRMQREARTDRQTNRMIAGMENYLGVSTTKWPEDVERATVSKKFI